MMQTRPTKALCVSGNATFRETYVVPLSSLMGLFHRYRTFSTRASTSYLVPFFIPAQSRFQAIPTGSKTGIKQTDDPK